MGCDIMFLVVLFFYVGVGISIGMFFLLLVVVFEWLLVLSSEKVGVFWSDGLEGEKVGMILVFFVFLIFVCVLFENI